MRQPRRIGTAAARKLDLPQGAFDQNDFEDTGLQILRWNQWHRRLNTLRQVQRLDVAHQGVQIVTTNLTPQIGFEHFPQLHLAQQLTGREEHFPQKHPAL